MLSGLLMVWLSWMVLGTWAARWFGEQRNDDALGCDGTKSIIITDVSVEGARLPHGPLDEAVVARAESMPKPRAQARRRSARGPPPASSMSVCRRGITTT
jgi:hypothetical protein